MDLERGATEQLLAYAERDARIVDYHPFRLPGSPIWFRGPPPEHLHPGGYLVCLGAADTLGCLCDHPFPTLVGESLGLPVVNLGYGGASPQTYLGDPALLAVLDGARAVVVQVMSARGESNSLYESTGVLQRVRRRSDGAVLRGDKAWRAIAEGESPGRVTELLAETRRSWVASHSALLSRVRPPTVLFYLSRRSPEELADIDDVDEAMHVFPQFVTRSMLDEAGVAADAVAECTSRRGAPQPLFDRVTREQIRLEASPGVVWPVNDYYPSPEMHADAAALLLAVLDGL